MGYLANIRLEIDKEGNAFIVYHDDDEMQKCETQVEAKLWAARYLFEGAMADLQRRINCLDYVPTEAEAKLALDELD